MNYLVDAHTLVWALDSPDKLSTNAVLVLENLDRRQKGRVSFYLANL